MNAARSLEYLRAARSGIRTWDGPARSLEYLRAARSGIRTWDGPARSWRDGELVALGDRFVDEHEIGGIVMAAALADPGGPAEAGASAERGARDFVAAQDEPNVPRILETDISAQPRQELQEGPRAREVRLVLGQRERAEPHAKARLHVRHLRADDGPCAQLFGDPPRAQPRAFFASEGKPCLLYTSDAADEE